MESGRRQSSLTAVMASEVRLAVSNALFRAPTTCQGRMTHNPIRIVGGNKEIATCRKCGKVVYAKTVDPKQPCGWCQSALKYKFVNGVKIGSCQMCGTVRYTSSLQR